MKMIEEQFFEKVKMNKDPEFVTKELARKSKLQREKLDNPKNRQDYNAYHKIKNKEYYYKKKGAQ